MLAQYHRWIFENHRWEIVETIKKFVLQEAEFQTVASETIRGVTSSNRNVDSRRNRSEKAFFGNAQESEIQKYRPCKVCKGHHGVWRCDKFKDLPVQERWNSAKCLKLCFRCLGPAGNQRSAGLQTNFTRTYFVREQQENSDEISNLLRRFWEIENYGTSTEFHPLTTDEKASLEKLEESIKYVDGRYQVAIPWKDDEPALPNNYEMALRRLLNTEKRLLKNPEIGEAYTNNINQYLEKGYIRRLDPTEKSPLKKWYLPHFPVVRPDRTTTKTRIVFDVSAKFEGVSLNDAIYQGPKLQRELTDVLLRFRRNPVALMCDIAEMYLRIEVVPKDRPYQRFLWRTQEPDEYEFNRVVFGVNSSPLQAHFVAQTQAEKHKDEFPMAAETVLKSTYVDDCMDSVVDES